MIGNRILFNKIVPLDYFYVNINEKSSRKNLPTLEKKVIDQWPNYVLKMKELGVSVWNGKMYRLDNIKEIENGSKDLQISSDLDFAHTIILNSKDFESLSSDYYNNNIATTGIVQSIDGYTIWETKYNTTNPYSITPLGGALQPDELKVNDFLDFYNNLLKEIEEETLITKKDIIESNLFGIFCPKFWGNVIFCYFILLNLSSSEIQTLLNKALKKGESDKLELVHNSKLLQFSNYLEKDSIVRDMIETHMNNGNYLLKS